MQLPLPSMPWVEPKPLLDEAGDAILNAAGEIQYQINYLNYGSFISAVINFIIIAFVIFLMVKLITKLTEIGKKKELEVIPAPPEPSAEEKLLTEIRDLLKEK